MHRWEQTVEMLLIVPAVGIQSMYEMQQACSLLAHAHFTLPVALRINQNPPALPPLRLGQAALTARLQAGIQNKADTWLSKKEELSDIIFLHTV